MSTAIKYSSKRSPKTPNLCASRKLRGRKKKKQEPPTPLQQLNDLTILSMSGSKEEDEDLQHDDLLAIAASMMNNLFCGSLYPTATSFPVKAGGCESKAMDFFLNCFAPAQTTLRMTLNASLHTADPLVSAIFPLALHHEELFHAVVAMSLCSIESSSFYESDGHVLKQPSADIFYHRHWALSFLREKLTPPCCLADNAALVTTTALLLLDGILGDTDSLRAHCVGLRQMINARGGIDSPEISRLLRYFILQCDYCWALEAGLPVAFTLPKLNIRSPLETVPPGFQDLDFPDEVAAPLIEIIARMSSWTKAVSRVWDSTENAEHQGVIFSYAPFHDTCEALELLEATEKDSLAAALCFALVLISQNFYGKGRFYKWYQRIREQLTSALLHQDTSALNYEERRCFVWIWMVATESWRISSRLLPPGLELMQILQCHFEESWDWDQLEELLKSFLWYDSLGVKWKACWQESMVASGLENPSGDAVYSFTTTPPTSPPLSICPSATSLT